MNPIFENRTVITKEILTEFSMNTFKIYSKKLRMFLLVFTPLCILCVVVESITKRFDFTSIFMVIASVFFIFIFFKGYIFRMKQNYKNFLGVYGELPQFTYTFSEDNLQGITSHSNVNLNYSQITKIIETKNLYILMIEKQGLILIKDSFTIGNSDDFKLFISDKCTNTQVYN